MSDTNDRAVAVTFSMRLSSVEKLETLVRSTGKNRSELLAEWIEKKFDELNPEPQTIEEELARR